MIALTKEFVPALCVVFVACSCVSANPPLITGPESVFEHERIELSVTDDVPPNVPVLLLRNGAAVDTKYSFENSKLVIEGPRAGEYKFIVAYENRFLEKSVTVKRQSIEGKYAILSADYDGSVMVKPKEIGRDDTYVITWLTRTEGEHFGIGLRVGNLLSVGWPEGVVVYEISWDERRQGHELVGRYSQRGYEGVYDETLVFAGPVPEMAERGTSSGPFGPGDLAALKEEDADGNEYWYYVRIVEKVDDEYRAEWLLGGEVETLVSEEELLRHEIRVNDRIEFTNSGEDANVYKYFQVVVQKAVNGRLKLVDDKGKVYETSDLRFIRFRLEQQ